VPARPIRATEAAKTVLLVLFAAVAIVVFLAPPAEPPTLEESISTATNFLLERQQPDGSWTTRFTASATSTLGRPFVEETAGFTYTPFTTTYITHTLSLLERTPEAQAALAASVRFLLRERNSSGLWNFYGRELERQEMPVPEDTDDTATALAALAENGAAPADALTALNKLRREDGNYWVWTNPVNGGNGVECVVSANSLYALSLLNDPGENSALCSYLVSTAGKFEAGDTSCRRYYPPLVFAHAYSRALADGKAQCLAGGAQALRKFVENAQTDGGWWGSVHNTCTAITALLNLGAPASSVEGAVRRVLKEQRGDGSWPAHAWFVGPFRLYGSSESTTGFCLEALVKYRRAGGV